MAGEHLGVGDPLETVADRLAGILQEDHPGVARLSHLLEALSAENLETLEHIVQCPRCRRLAREGPEDEGEDDDSEPFALPMFEESLRGILASLEEDEGRAPALYGELMALPPDERPKVLHEPRFSSPGLARLLLQRSEELLAADPREAEVLAGFALDLLTGHGAAGARHTGR